MLIPGVGMAPVGQFQFLITLFAIGIGPLNYWLLKRRNKLPWLLVTVPVAAAATTLLLFSYGVLADGFDTRIRARSITVLDQRAGTAASWARLSYYAGIAPRQGLTFSDDTAMYPVRPNWDAALRWRSSGTGREMLWRRDDQRLTQGWLASRTPTQYLQVASRPTSKQLQMRATESGLQVANRLGVEVTHLAVQDRQGRLYWGEKLAPGERRVLATASRPDVTGKIRKLFTDNLPEFLGPTNQPSAFGLRSGRQYGSEASLAQNLMEAHLAAINSPLVEAWPDGSYIAFTASGVEVELGVEDAVEEASFHVIRGSW